MRSLASIQKIKSLTPIPNADKIELARISGWDVVVQKGQFEVGSWCVYVEIDSILPDREPFEFLKKTNGKMQRIRTIKLRGQVSQGIAFTLDALMYMCKEKNGERNTMMPLLEDYDVTEIMQVTKYEPEETGGGHPGPRINMRSKGKRPSFVPKTDQTRVEVLGKLVEKYQGEKVWISEKLDGSSFSAYYNNGDFGVCSRNLDVTRIKPSLWERIKRWISRNLLRKMEMNHRDRVDAWNKVAIKYDLEVLLKKFGRNIVLQGEIIGPKIQKNKYKMDEVDLYIFDVYDIDQAQYLSFDDLAEIVATLSLKMVPVIATDFILNHTVDELSALSDGYSELNKETLREGIVVKPMKEIYDPDYLKLYRSRVSFKAVSKKFLLKYDM